MNKDDIKSFFQDISTKDLSNDTTKSICLKIIAVLLVFGIVGSNFKQINIMLSGDRVQAQIVDVYSESKGTGKNRHSTTYGVYSYNYNGVQQKTTVTLPTKLGYSVGKSEKIYISTSSSKNITTKKIVFLNLLESIFVLILLVAVILGIIKKQKDEN